MSINNSSSTTIIIFSSKTLSICNYTHNSFLKNTFNLSSRCEQVSTRIESYFQNNMFSCFFRKIQIRVCSPFPSNNTQCIQDCIDYSDGIPLRQFRPQKDQRKPLRQRRNGQVSRIKRSEYVCIGQPIVREIHPPY